MRIVLALGLALGLAACAGGASPDGGVANYDALRQAHEKCAARGGTLALKLPSACAASIQPPI